MDLVAERKPRFVLEIGTARGGTAYLWTKVVVSGALIVTIDVEDKCRPGLLQSFGSRGTRVEQILGDSKSHDVVEDVRRRFPDGIDFLFIDGDHSYDGVKSDYEIYAPLVRAGGVVAFHDIIPTSFRTAHPAERGRRRTPATCRRSGARSRRIRKSWSSSRTTSGTEGASASS
jgi:predicted O-methyltransferase YrrM